MKNVNFFTCSTNMLLIIFVFRFFVRISAARSFCFYIICIISHILHACALCFTLLFKCIVLHSWLECVAFKVLILQVISTYLGSSCLFDKPKGLEGHNIYDEIIFWFFFYFFLFSYLMPVNEGFIREWAIIASKKEEEDEKILFKNNNKRIIQNRDAIKWMETFPKQKKTTSVAESTNRAFDWMWPLKILWLN